jgi:Ca2+-binding RTX toxin-like protein
VSVISNLPDIPNPLDLSGLPGFDDALASQDGEIVIRLFGDNDVTTGDGDDLIVTGLGDDTIDAGDGDNTVYADNIPNDSIGGDDKVTTGSGDDEIYTFGGDDVVSSGDGSDIVFTADGDDIIDAGAGNDDVQSGRGRDQVLGGDGDDVLRGGEDDDILDGGPGNDRVIGGSDDDRVVGGLGDDLLEGRSGADTFLFDPSRAEGADSIVDFTQADGDVVALSAAGLANVGLEEFSGTALDESDAFNLVADEETGDLVIEHPGGTITLNGVPFAEEGQEPPTFAGLEAAGLLAIEGLVRGTDAGEELTGTEGDDVINALGGDDTITPLSGDDIITTGDGRDTVNVDPSNSDEGHDVITDFNAPNDLDSAVGDSINFASADVLEADPDLPAADGDANSLSLADFDASENWTLGSSEGGNLLLTHPNGSVELTNLTFSGQTFAGLGPMIKVDDTDFGEPIPVGDGIDGEDGTDGEEVAGGEDGLGGEDVTGSEDIAGGEQEVAEISPSESLEEAIA